jgi:hypothetical protein
MPRDVRILTSTACLQAPRDCTRPEMTPEFDAPWRMTFFGPPNRPVLFKQWLFSFHQVSMAKLHRKLRLFEYFELLYRFIDANIHLTKLSENSMSSLSSFTIDMG